MYAMIVMKKSDALVVPGIASMRRKSVQTLLLQSSVSDAVKKAGV